MNPQENPFSKEAMRQFQPGGNRKSKAAKADAEKPGRINVKQKGNRYELYIAKILQEWFPARKIRRSGMLQATSSGSAFAADVIGCGKWHPEVKDCQALSMFDWLRKMLESCSLTGDFPVLFFHQPANKGYKGHDEDWLVCRVEDFPMLAMDFMEAQK